jgi:hypothetical protein
MLWTLHASSQTGVEINDLVEGFCVADVLGFSRMHHPPLSRVDDSLTRALRWEITVPSLPEEIRHPKPWPERVRAEWVSATGLIRHFTCYPGRSTELPASL